MHHDALLFVQQNSPTSGTCVCPCGQQFIVDSVEERNLVFDSNRRLLRAVCPRCARLEEPSAFWVGAKPEARDPARGRIAEYLD